MQRCSERSRHRRVLVGDGGADPAAVGCRMEPGRDELAEQRDGGAVGAVGDING